ncbi:signal recognition particle [Agrobacterium tumefaciens]|uniref:signal recognition particle n=1 Tax=Agrobacterium tumefaciens TaxID=358 RepID=UPI001F3C7370|nr:signal recognition particle [Agrobacterium tumefaciens]
MKPTLILAPLLMFATAVSAAPEKVSGQIAVQLGTVLAAEDFCGLTYDHKMIEAYIEKNVPADDMGFPSFLELMTSGRKSKQKKMTPSAKAAHCAQISRVAKANGFIR